MTILENSYIKSALAAAVLGTSVLWSGCKSAPELEAPEPPAKVKPAPDDWASYQSGAIAAKANYIAAHQEAYDWFSEFAFSETDGTPFLLLKLLPKIAPAIWGGGDNFLDVIGLFDDERHPNYPIARGIGISAFARAAGEPLMMDYTSVTCAACHMGRVIDDNGKTHYIDGGVNTEFNIVLYRVKLNQTLQNIIGSEADETQQLALLTDAFLKALGEVRSEDPNYFYENYSYNGVTYDAAYETEQVNLFMANAAEQVSKFHTTVSDDLDGYGHLLDKNYKGFQARMLEGFPGMADATGISTANGYEKVKHSKAAGLASLILPKSPGITDFMSVWEQDKRKAEWNDKETMLINGGGQWNGNIPIPMYRNMAAQLTLGLSNNDLRVSSFGVELLDGLPASVYPFDVDVNLAKKGEGLFAKNCAQCHQPHNGKVYTELGVNLDRSYVVDGIIRTGAIIGFSKQCNPDTVLDMPPPGNKPCAEYDGVSLKGKKKLVMSPNSTHHGYNARPLSGIWAQAPYLHNGSVPTVYHLLLPSERPDIFVKSRLTYDQEKLGYAWTPGPVSSSSEHAYEFDTTSFKSFSNAGHDKDITEGDVTYKLDWSNDKAGAMAIVEYMKTL